MDEEYVPTINDIKYLTENLLFSAGNKGKKLNTNMTICSGRFEAFWNNHLIVFFTSNRPPEDLYLNGLQRFLFLPFIDEVKE